ncbi:MAG: hypothetical protein OHK0039_37580 [Bacteroidia bacterium]
MEGFELRPRFQLALPHPPGEILARLRQRIDAGAPCKARFAGQHVVLMMPADQTHVWSPQFSMDVEPQEDGGASIRGIFGPNPSIWTFFVFVYAAIGVLTTIIGMYGLSLWTLHKPAPHLWVFPIGAALAALVYLAGQAGKRTGHDQMEVIRRFLGETLASLDQVSEG